jgi:hypothetical protein
MSGDPDQNVAQSSAPASLVAVARSGALARATVLAAALRAGAGWVGVVNRSCTAHYFGANTCRLECEVAIESIE